MMRFKTCPTLVNHLHRIMLQFCGGHSVPNVSLNFDNSPSEQLVLIAHAIAIQNKYLGMMNMFFGVVSPLFCSSQAKYYETHPQGRNFTPERWGKWIIRSMLEFTVSLWHYRCELVHSKGNGTMEQRLRSLATEWLHNLQTNPDLLPFKSRHLINRSARYFQSGDVRAINAWVRRIDAEMKNAKVTAHAGDIRRWMVPNSKSESIYHRAEASPFPKNSSQKGRLWTPGRFEYYASSW